MLQLTCVEQPFERMAQAVMEILTADVQESEGGKSELRLIPPTLVARQ
jgi:DNA-binding LacI/PurR family transcriptional regulator